jgi:hypothetical protein
VCYHPDVNPIVGTTRCHHLFQNRARKILQLIIAPWSYLVQLQIRIKKLRATPATQQPELQPVDSSDAIQKSEKPYTLSGRRLRHEWHERQQHRPATPLSFCRCSKFPAVAFMLCYGNGSRRSVAGRNGRSGSAVGPTAVMNCNFSFSGELTPCENCVAAPV